MPRAVILVAEDSPDDRLLLGVAFARVGAKVPIQYVRDGVEAIDYLNGAGAYADRDKYPLPAVMLLDLNMPRVNGFEFLEWRRKAYSRTMPIIVYSTSSLNRDVQRAYELGANSYLVKGDGLEDLQNVARSVIDYWLTSNLFPSAA